VVDESSVVGELSCGICLSVPHIKPVTTICEHLFCRECLQTALESFEATRSDDSFFRCPCCRMESDERFHDLIHRPLRGIARRIWQNVKVECPFDVCKWTGTMGNYRSHLNECSDVILNHLRYLENKEIELSNELVVQRNLISYHESNNDTLNAKMTKMTEELASVKSELEKLKEIKPYQELERLKSALAKSNKQLADLQFSCQVVEKDEELKEAVQEQNMEELKTIIQRLESEREDLMAANQELLHQLVSDGRPPKCRRVESVPAAEPEEQQSED
jgi:RING-type zinc-finger